MGRTYLLKTVADEVRLLMRKMPCLLRYDWSRPIIAEIFIICDNEKQENKATRKSISLETKAQVIRRLDSGIRQSQISAALNLETTRTILKNKGKILSSATTTTSSSATRVTCSRNNIIEEMGKRLSIWIDDEIERNMPLRQSITMEKARRIFNYIQAEASDISETFVASRGWFN
ncbi:uncharacterized protein TNCV_1397601 [Trichonephila clavipes]|nr:uncharacterized protein TNCV_1397601 [Trichonephila clavipes]